MPVFNVSFLNPNLKAKKGAGVGILADQLAILENSLAKDGYLSPGDYDILIKKARDIQMSGSLSADQRSNYDVKISEYEKSKSVSNMNKTDDIARMNKMIKGEAAEDVMVVGNNPREFLKGRIASLQSKLGDLNDTIQRKTAAGDDTIDYYNEYNATLQEYSNKSEALDAINSFDQKNPIQGYVAYVSTNKNGEIVDVDYAKYGEKSGYAETNGMIDGFQVYGKVNYKEDGKNYFKLGNKTFTAADRLIQDPANPGSFKPTKLMADVQDPSGRGEFTRAQAGYVNLPGNSIPIQSYIPRNSWAKGINGTLYKRGEDGKYTKYLNATEDNLQIDGPVLNIPEVFEQSLMKNVGETVDYSSPITPNQGSEAPVPLPDNPPIPSAPIKMNYGLDNPFSAPDQKTSRSQILRTPKQPSEQAPTGPLQTAKRTIQSGIESVKNLFK